MNYLYLALNLGCISIPFIYSFHPRLKFHRKWPTLFPALILSTTGFCIWDSAFTKAGIWGFNSKYLLGIFIGNLPIEEILFFICVPYACLFTYSSFRVLFPAFNKPCPAIQKFTLILAIVLIIAALFNLNRIYTSVNFLVCAAALLIARSYIPQLLPQFFLSYTVILLPFFLMNGVLTGSFIPEEVVWYNNQEILGIRMFTIPLEDTFYGLALILINLMVMQILGQIIQRRNGPGTAG